MSRNRGGAPRRGGQLAGIPRRREARGGQRARELASFSARNPGAPPRPDPGRRLKSSREDSSRPEKPSSASSRAASGRAPAPSYLCPPRRPPDTTRARRTLGQPGGLAPGGLGPGGLAPGGLGPRLLLRVGL